MKAKMLATATTAFLLFVSAETFAQPAPPPPPPGKGPRPHMGQALQPITAFAGQAGTWATNDDFIYDGFYLQTATEKLLVKFSPKMGSQLQAIIKNGSSVTVNGTARVSPLGEKEIRFVSITAGGKTIYDTPPVRPATEPTEDFVTGSGKVSELQKNKAGEVSGFILDSKTILKVPPHVAAQLSQMVAAGAAISYTGVKKAAGDGEVKAKDYSIIHCKTISINGTEYLVR